MTNKIFRKCDKICRECGRLVCVCCLVVVPVIEAINSPAEECRLSAPCSWGDSSPPHGEEHDYVTNPPAIEHVAETGRAADPFPPGRRSNADMMVLPAYRYRPFYRSDNGASMGSRLTLGSISTSA